MSSAIALPWNGEIDERQSNNITTARPQDIGDVNHIELEEEMTKADIDRLNEALAQQAESNGLLARALAGQIHSAETGNGKSLKLFLAGITLITVLGQGGSFLATQAIAVGGKNKELEQIEKENTRLESRVQDQEQRLREYEVWLQTTREKLADRGWKMPPLPKGRD